MNRSTLSLIALITAVVTDPAAADEWTRFRGPNGQGISDATTIPVKFSEADYNWKVSVPEGHGSPVIWDDKVFVVGAKGTDRIVACLSTKDGESLWTKAFPVEEHHLHGFNHYGTSTPAVDGERVYLYLGSERNAQVVALDHAGNSQWATSLGGYVGKHGPSTSVMLFKGMVFVTHDQDPSGAVVALNKSDGKLRWKIDRNGADNGASYGVPVILEGKDGRDQLIVSSKANGVTGIDPIKGEVLWELNDLLPLRSVAGPVLIDGLIFVQCGSGGAGKRFVAVQPAVGSGDASLKWDSTRGIPYVPTPIGYKGHLYYITDGGFAACLNPADGKVIWNERIGDRLGFFGSPICVNGNLYAIAKEGEVVVIRAKPEGFELLAINPLGEKSYGTPAVADGKMYLRTLNHLISVGGN